MTTMAIEDRIGESKGTKDTSAFWQTFCERHWEKNDLVIANPPIEAGIGHEDLFHAIVDNIIDGKSLRCMMRLFVAGKSIDQDNPLFWEYMPKHSDGSFQGYNQRLTSDLDDKEYMYAIDNFVVPESLFEWRFQLLKGMHEKLGHLQYGHFLSVFYGNYQGTSFGIHQHRKPPEAAMPLSSRI